MPFSATAQRLWWLIQKDLSRELRAHETWPKMLLVGLVLVLLLAATIDLPMEPQTRVVSGLLWITIFVSGTMALDQSFASEHESGCWQTLLLYPVAPGVVFLAKMAVNMISIVVLEAAIIPLFIVLTDVPLLAHPGSMTLVLLLGSFGFAAAGTLVGALTAGLRSRGGLLAVALLPLLAPVMISSAESTRLALAGEPDPLWWWWIQLLAGFALTFTIVGTSAFGFVMED